jgi:hypothetical protein
MVNFELLKEAYAIIDGIPKRRFNLNRLAVPKQIDGNHHRAGQPLRAECGSIACAIGWLAMHPTFNAMGLWINQRGVLFLGTEAVKYDWAARYIFGLDRYDAVEIFTNAEYERGDHKSIWQARVRSFLEQHHQL